MKRRVFTLLSALAAGLLITGCNQQVAASSNANSASAIAEPASSAPAQKIVIGMDDDFPPLCFRNEKDDLVGYDIDMAREATKRMNLEVEFKPIEWSAKEAELNNKHIDAIWGGLTITNERKKNILFTKPYMQNHQIVIVATKSPIQVKAELENKVVGVEDGSTSIEAVNNEENLAKSMKVIKKFANNNIAMKELTIGRLDAVVIDEAVGRYYISQKPGQYRILDENFGSEEYGVGLRKEDTELLAKLEIALSAMNADGSAKKIYAKWFEANASK